MEEVYAYLDTLQTVDLSPKINAMQGKIQKNIEVDIKEVKAQIAKAENELDVLNDEIVKTLTNESNFTSAQLYKIITKKEDEIEKLMLSERELEKELSVRLREVNTFVERKEMIANWRNELESSEVEVQRMFLSNLIESVVLSKDKIDVNFRFDLFDLE
jgi:septal ring factor EnvC (AmiA/AmiB activator)